MKRVPALPDSSWTIPSGRARESRQLVRVGVDAGEQHLEGDVAIELEVFGPEDHAHAATAQNGLHVIVGNQR